MLADGITEPTSSPYSSPVVLAKKKSGQPRFCVDYQKLNSITEDYPQPIPNIPDALKDLGNAKIFSTLDLKSGYWQIPMEPASKKYTAFATPSGGSYQFRVMPFGLKGAPGTFQRLMSQEVLTGYIGKFCIVYLDDIIIYSRNIEDHLHHLALVLERLHIHHLTASLEKCQFGMERLEYLGHIVTTDGNEANPEYVKAIIEAPTPKTKRQLQSFLGTCNWLREYVPHYSAITAPLNELTVKKSGFRWNTEAQKAFERLKEAFNQPLKLSRPDPKLPYVLHTDACATGMGAALYQPREDGGKNIISYSSAKFKPAETRYHSNEQECLAVVWAVKKYRHLLEDRPFTLKTDNKGLTWLHRFKETRDKLKRWALLLQEFNMKIEHCPGKENQLADLLSRNPVEEITEELDDQERLLPPINDEAVPLSEVEPDSAIFTIDSLTLVEEIRDAQQNDPYHSKMAKRYIDLTQRNNLTEEEQCFINHYGVIDGVLWKRDEPDRPYKILVPQAAVARVLYEYHDSKYTGHP